MMTLPNGEACSVLTKEQDTSKTICNFPSVSNRDQQVYDALLISAAPELLAMCKLILAFLEALENEGNVKISKGDRIVTDLIKKVVNKAEGKE